LGKYVSRTFATVNVVLHGRQQQSMPTEDLEGLRKDLADAVVVVVMIAGH
jgi:hypothetical protein